ncbi:phosphoribosyltransferase family protein [Enorma sp.]|uniref:ComF family protein n=1 Tax=Enorma sp. TaxID=1920692 RepID=UPI0025B9A960|nr:phosphoribosyltransferase family protein [Enorma sp.]
MKHERSIPIASEGDAAAVFGRGSLAGRLREAALEVLSPTRCAGCERPGELICKECLARIEVIDPVHACTRCGAPFGDLLCTECGAGADEDVAPPGKDAGERRLGALIAELMLDAAEHAELVAPDRFGGILNGAEAVTFVPVTAAAFSRRGFDHMEVIARRVAELAGLPLIDALAKHGSADQRSLGRVERQERSRDVYEVVESVEGMRFLLLDDVITTGATMRAAASALHAAGAAHVDALAFARVW